MFINIGDMIGSYEVTISVYLGNQLINQSQLCAPQPILEAQFTNLVQQITQQNQPMKVIMERKEVIWDPFEQKEKVLPCSIEFRNYTIPEECGADR